MQSLFLLSPVGEVVIERHFRDVVTSRSVCDTFWERASAGLQHHGSVSYDTVPPVMEVPESDQGTLYLISILRDGLSYLAVCPAEVSPLLILEFLHRTASIFEDYFGGRADEAAIRDNFATVYQLLEEMVDYGWPLTTEPNALKAMVRPPTVMGQLLGTTQESTAGAGTISNIPWRSANVQYSQNEIYMDIVEEVDAIVDSNGSLVSCDVSGSIECQSHLSGVPDLLLTFADPSLIDDCSFHPCVRYSRFENDQVLSFVPPDGNFQLVRYRIPRDKVQAFVPPLYCHVQWTPGKAVSLQVGVTSLHALVLSASKKGPLQMEDVAVQLPFPSDTVSTSGFQVSMGSVVYDEASKMAQWKIGTLEGKATLQCGFQATSKSTDQPHVSLQWKIPLASVSGLSVSGLSVTGESYRPYKGVRNVTKSGRFQVRSG